MATPTTLNDVVTLAVTAAHHPKTSVPANDALTHARSITCLEFFILEELEARFPAVDALLEVDMTLHKGLDAISEYVRLQRLHDAPDLLPLAIERAMAEMWAYVFEGKDEAPWPR